MEKQKIALLGMIITTAIVLMAFVLPWYSMNMKMNIMGFQTDVSQDMFLTHIDVKGSAAGQDMSQSMNWDEFETTDLPYLSPVYFQTLCIYGH